MLAATAAGALSLVGCGAYGLAKLANGCAAKFKRLKPVVEPERPKPVGSIYFDDHGTAWLRPHAKAAPVQMELSSLEPGGLRWVRAAARVGPEANVSPTTKFSSCQALPKGTILVGQKVDNTIRVAGQMVRVGVERALTVRHLMGDKVNPLDSPATFYFAGKLAAGGRPEWLCVKDLIAKHYFTGKPTLVQSDKLQTSGRLDASDMTIVNMAKGIFSVLGVKKLEAGDFDYARHADVSVVTPEGGTTTVICSHGKVCYAPELAKGLGVMLHDANTLPGSSGATLRDAAGNVVGMHIGSRELADATMTNVAITARAIAQFILYAGHSEIAWKKQESRAPGERQEEASPGVFGLQTTTGMSPEEEDLIWSSAVQIHNWIYGGTDAGETPEDAPQGGGRQNALHTAMRERRFQNRSRKAGVSMFDSAVVHDEALDGELQHQTFTADIELALDMAAFCEYAEVVGEVEAQPPVPIESDRNKERALALHRLLEAAYQGDVGFAECGEYLEKHGPVDFDAREIFHAAGLARNWLGTKFDAECPDYEGSTTMTLIGKTARRQGKRDKMVSMDADDIALAQRLGLPCVNADGMPTRVMPPRDREAVAGSLKQQLEAKILPTEELIFDEDGSERTSVTCILETAAEAPFEMRKTSMSFKLQVITALACSNYQASAAWTASAYSGNGTVQQKKDLRDNPQFIDDCITTLVLMCVHSTGWLSKMTPKDLFRLGLLEPEEVFVKAEPHDTGKAATGRWRLIWDQGFRAEIVQRCLHDELNKALITRYQRYPASIGRDDPMGILGALVGTGHDDTGYTRTETVIQTLAAHAPDHKVGFQDTKGYDMSVTRSMFIAEAMVRMVTARHIAPGGMQCTNPTAFLEAYAKAITAQALLSSAHVVRIGEDLVQVNRFGIVGSGSVSTSVTDTLTGNLRFRVATESEDRPVGIMCVSLGDDMMFAGENVDELRMRSLGAEVKIQGHTEVSKGVEFTSHAYTCDGRPPRFLNFEKMAAKMLLAFKTKTPQRDVVQGLKFALRNSPQELRMLEMLYKEKGWDFTPEAKYDEDCDF